FGQQVQRQAADGGVWQTTRDKNGWVTSTIDPLGRGITYQVNARGQVLAESRPDGSFATWDYSGADGSLVQHVDFAGNTWSYTNDSHGERTSETDPLGNTTTYTWSDGLLQTITDPLNETTTELYDADRRPTGEEIGGVTDETDSEDSDGDPA